MKKIITSLGMVVFVGAVVAGGTGAFFSDTETSSANVFTAGAIDLKVDSVAHINGLVCFDGKWVPESEVEWNASTSANQLVLGANVASATVAYNLENPSNVPQAGGKCEGTWALTDLGPIHTFFDYGDLKPGDNGENTISLHVINNDAYMCAIVKNVESNDNSQTEPESIVDANGTTTGELDQELSFFIWGDDGDNIFEQGEQVLANNEDGIGIDGTYPLFTPQTGAMQASTTQYVGVYWCYGDLTVNGTNLSCSGNSVTNVSQTDSLKADIEFYIEQARNNENFRCPGVVTEPVTATATVDKIVTFTDQQIEGVEVNDFTLTIDGPGDPVVVTDNIPQGNLTPGVYTVSETYSGVPAGITYNATFGGSCTEIGDTNTATMTLVEGNNPTCTITNSISPLVD